MGKGQIPTQEGLDKARRRSPFEWPEIHSDIDKGFVNRTGFQLERNLVISEMN